MSNTRVLTIMGLVLAAFLSRLVPHPTNWTAIGALAIWSGFLLRNRILSIVVLFAVIIVTDLMIGTHVTMPWTLGAYGLIAILSSAFAFHKNALRLAVGSLAASVIFFVISNFGVWVTTGFYSHTWQGLVNCFTLAIPFFSHQAAGDLVYCTIFAAVIYMAKLSEPVEQTQSQPVSRR